MWGLSPVSEVQTSLGLTLPPQQSELWAKEGLGTQIRLGCRVAGTSKHQTEVISREQPGPTPGLMVYLGIAR